MIGATKGSLTDAGVVALIEIREALEDWLGILATGQRVIAKEIADVIRENTAVQQQILDRSVDAEQSFKDLAANLTTLLRDIEGVRATMKLHGDLMETIGSVQDEQAESIRKLAEEKQDQAGGVETRAFVPDAG